MVLDSKPRVKAVVDTEKNRLIITMAGHIDEKSMAKLCADVRSCTLELRHGFTVINDLSLCSFIHLPGLAIYKKIIDHFILSKVGEIIRIIDSDNISYGQIKKLSEKVNCYKPIYAESYNEAVNYLESVFKRKAIRFKINKLSLEYEILEKYGTGVIADISTSGCAIESPSLLLSPKSNPMIILNFDHHDSIPATFRLTSTVVRTGENIFAVEFTDLADEQKEQLYKRLAYEVTRSVYLP